jgi:hypothetical protein
MADYYVALLRLRANDHSGYRAACIAARDRQLEKSKPAFFYVVCAGVAAPDSGVDPGQLVKLAEDGLSQHPDDPAWLTIHGAALYRASRWQDAQTTLTKAIAAYDSLRASSRQTNAHVHALLLQAIVTHRLNRKDEAQPWFKAALKKLESDGSASQSNYGGMSWDCRLTAQQLRQEAEQLLVNNGGNASNPTDQVVDRSSAQRQTLDDAQKVQE